MLGMRFKHITQTKLLRLSDPYYLVTSKLKLMRMQNRKLFDEAFGHSILFLFYFVYYIMFLA